MNEWCIYIALYCVLLYTQSSLQSCVGGVSPQPPPVCSIHLDDSAIKQLTAINCIQNKNICLHNICACSVYILYIYIYIYKHIQYIFWNYLHVQWGKKVFSQAPILQVLPLKKMREACNCHHRYTSTMRDKIRKKNPENHIVGFLKNLFANYGGK